MNRGSAHRERSVPSRFGRFNEAPIHESGKYGLRARAGSRLRRASMRPRFMNRGSAVRRSSQGLAPHRFNEAPIHESGKSGSLSSSTYSTCGFNEAPIHESGKFIARFAVSATRLGFNEAPIHESGKSGRIECGRSQGIDASMRPRFMNRGSPDSISTLCQGGSASMRPRFMNRGSPAAYRPDSGTRHRFNEAPIHESGKLLCYRCGSFVTVASMRPRFMNRGSTAPA